MSGIQQLLLGGSPAGYQIERSLRFNSADSASLNRTPSSAGNRKTWTWSSWVKRGSFGGAAKTIISAGASGTNPSTGIQITGNEIIQIYDYTSSYNFQLDTTPVYRDPSSWYHIVVAFDTTQATASNRIKLYVNGSQVTAFSTATYPTQNTDYQINSTNTHYISRFSQSAASYLDGYLTEVNFIDGQALTPSSFGQSNPNTGVWEPIRYTGTYGTNGFYLNFSDSSNTTAATLGKDYSGNGNNWTPNNFSVTAGAGNDSLVDTPTSYGTDTGAGGEVRGNYCTLNPLDSATSASNPTNGNLDWSSAAANASYYPSRGTLGMSSGKWYWEVTCGTSSGGFQIGIAGQAVNFANNAGQQLYNCSDGYAYLSSAYKGNNGSLSSYGATYTTNDVIGIALDMDAGTLVFYKNGVSQGTAYSSLSGTFFAAISDNSTSSNSAASFNFGQRPFANTAPSGFKALCTQNLPTPTIGATSTTQANDYFDATLWTGNGTTQSITNSGGMQPDFLWVKSRSGTTANWLVNAVTGAGNGLISNSTAAEQSLGIVTSLDSSGFSVSTIGGTNLTTNGNAATFVGWQWKANGAGSSNTAGSITSTVSANTTAGFSILTYTGNATTDATIGHGLGVTPQFFVVKNRSTTSEWLAYHVSTGKNGYMQMQSTAAFTSSSNYWGSTGPTSTTIQINGGGGVNNNGSNYVCYAFAPVAGYSAFGSYTGNGSSDGPFVFTNHRPAFLLIKRTDSTSNWTILDFKRVGYNVDNDQLYPNLSNAEATTDLADLLSNGFKLRSTDTSVNASGGTYVYAAFAEFPAKYSLAR